VTPQICARHTRAEARRRADQASCSLLPCRDGASTPRAARARVLMSRARHVSTCVYKGCNKTRIGTKAVAACCLGRARQRQLEVLGSVGCAAFNAGCSRTRGAPWQIRGLIKEAGKLGKRGEL
jgi:hypothetical protein